MAQPKRTIHYVCSTHWDREWYETFQDFRYRLVNMMDELLEVMRKDEHFRYFQTDGQAILLEDYLEIRPEREEQIRTYTEAGRLRVGPWYVSPDLFLPCGESLVRNLQMGFQVAAAYGARPMRAGFCCDHFGQISQLPQIFRGFSIDNAQFFRGSWEGDLGGMFIWKGADGSELLAYRFSPEGCYGHFAFKTRKAEVFDEKFNLDDATQLTREQIEFEKNRCPTDSLLLFDGVDHLEIEPKTSELLKRVNALLDDGEIIHSHMEGFFEDIREQKDKITHRAEGELRNACKRGDCSIMLSEVLSSRIPQIKQPNAACENELLLWAEPFATFAEQVGFKYPHQYLQTAWKWLLLNHPHDSICGCSIDQVHKDMEYRFDQSLQIARKQSDVALRQIALHCERPELQDHESTVTLFNPVGQAVSGPVDITLQFPADWEALFTDGFEYENKLSFRLFDPAGNEVPYQLVNQRLNRNGYYLIPKKIPKLERHHEIDVCIELDIPAFGYTTLICRPGEKKEPIRYLGSLLADNHVLENEYLQVSVQPNGTLTVLDKENDNTYESLLTFEDVSEIGDGWNHGTPVNDHICTSAACAADVAVVADGFAKATLKIAVTMNPPESFDYRNMARSERTAPLKLTSYVTLRKGSRKIEVRTVVDNTIRDHRLRVLMPSGASAETYFADGAYDVVERRIALSQDRGMQPELEVETRPQYTWTAVVDQQGNNRGLAVISTGLPESAVRDKPNRPIALTLLRSFEKTVFTNGENGGQMDGRHEFQYAIQPLDGQLPRAELCRAGQMSAAAPRGVQIDKRDLFWHEPTATLPAEHGFLPLPPSEAVVTALHRRPDIEGTILRMFNPHDKAIEEKIEFPARIKEAEIIDLEGKSKTVLQPSDKGLTLSLEPKQIVTFRIVC